MTTFTTDTKTFKAAIATFKAAAGVSRKSCVFLSLEPNGLRIVTHDAAVDTTIPGEVSQGEGVAYHRVYWQDLNKAITAASPVVAAPPVLTFTDEGITVAARAAVKVPALEWRELPAFTIGDVSKVASLPATMVNKGRGVLYAAGTDRTLPMLNAVHVTRHDGYLEFAATDRFRLVNAVLEDAGDDFSALIPAAVFKAAAGDLTVWSDDHKVGYVEVATGAGSLRARLVDADYPNVAPLFPKTAAAFIDADRVSLLEVAKLAKGLARNGVMTLEWTGHATAGDGEFSFTVHAVRGTANAVSVNPGYLSDALASMTADTVRIFMQEDAGRPVLMLENDYVSHILMPVRHGDGAPDPVTGTDEKEFKIDDHAPTPAVDPAPVKCPKTKRAKSKRAPRKAAESKTPAPARVAPAPVDPAPVEKSPAPVATDAPDLVSFEFKGVRISAPAAVWEEQIPAACGWLAMHNETWFKTFQDATGGRLRRAFTKLKATGLFEVATV